MALIKVRGWQLLMITMIAIPILSKLAKQIEEKAEKTEAEWDDVLAGAFRTVIEFLKSSEAFEKT